MPTDDLASAWAAAEEYNTTITENTFSGDAFSQEEENLRDTPYWKVVNLRDDGIMGYISLPKIGQRLPIYHGTSDEVLQIAAGHLSGTRLPIGGSGNHSVIAAHRGLPSAKLFSDLDKMEVGDTFYIHILDQTLAYRVDQILPMVDREDIQTLTSAMQNVPGEDYVTLFTCTPYGINSHRLLVRGTRTTYYGEDDEQASEETMLASIQNYYMLYGMLAAAVLLVLGIVINVIKRKKRADANIPGEVKDEKEKGE